MNIKRMAALPAVAGIAALAITATAVAATSTSSGIEHWTVESTNPVSATAVLIARGPLTVGLEATKSTSVPLYQHFGFQPTGNPEMPEGAPPLTAMWRPPATAPPAS